jgi:hypothetical protein
MPDPRLYSAASDATGVSVANPFQPKPQGADYLSMVAGMLKPDLTPISNLAHDAGTLLGINQDRYQMTGNDAMALALAAIPVTKTLPFKRVAKGAITDAEEVTLSHFSREARDVIDPKFLGTAAASEDLRQGVPTVANRYSNWYLGGKPEPRIANQFPVRHDVTGNFNLLDLASDEAKPLIDKAQKNASRSINGNFNEHLTKVVKGAGYDGLLNTEAPQSNVVRMFNPQVPTKTIYKK